MKSFFTKNPRNIAFSIVIILLALVPLFTDMGLLTSSSIVRFGRYITFAIVAIGIDLIWGYTGILSLGHEMCIRDSNCCFKGQSYTHLPYRGCRWWSRSRYY